MLGAPRCGLSHRSTPQRTEHKNQAATLCDLCELRWLGLDTLLVPAKTQLRYAVSYRVDLIRADGSVLQFELEFVVVGRSELQRVWRLPFKIVDFSQIPSIQVPGVFVGFECDRPVQNFQ